MEKLFDVLEIIKVRVNDLEDALDGFTEEHNELSNLRLKNEINELVFYWLEKDFNELKELIEEAL